MDSNAKNKARAGLRPVARFIYSLINIEDPNGCNLLQRSKEITSFL